MIPDAIVDEVRARADIVEIVGEQVPLRRSGKDFKARCPFHNEKTPSFYVVPAKGFYTCFGCGESGDVFSFLMKRAGLSFNEAVRHIATRVGIEVPDTGSGPREEPYRALYEAIAFAADHFQQMLREGAAGEAARRYLEGRGVPVTAWDRFLLGCAPDAWRELREAAQRHGIGDDVLLEAGLIKESDRSEEPYDRFRDRLIFPIAAVSGRVVAFGGRALGRSENTPKYLNSPETPIHHKGGTLYGLNWSKGAIRREGRALVVEGYMDYVTLAARGVENVVAGMGTALTPEQANLLARYTGTVWLLYDSDSAGLRATFRSGDALLRAGVHPLVVTLPAGEDPDSLVRKKGAEGLRPHLDGAVDVLEKKLAMLRERGFFDDVDGRRRALDRLLPTLRSTVDAALRDIYVARVAEHTDVRRETLERELATVPDTTAWEPPFGGHARRPWRGRSGAGRGPEGGARQRLRRDEAERLLLLILVRDPVRMGQAAQRVGAGELRDRLYRAAYEALLAGVEGAALEESGLEEPVARVLAELRADQEEIEDPEAVFLDVVADIEDRTLNHRLEIIDGELGGAEYERQKVLVRERQELLRQRRRVSRTNKSRRLRAHARHVRPEPQQPSTEDG